MTWFPHFYKEMAGFFYPVHDMITYVTTLEAQEILVIEID